MQLFLCFELIRICDNLFASLAKCNIRANLWAKFFFFLLWLNRFLFYFLYSHIIGNSPTADVPTEWLDLKENSGCMREMRRQIQAEIDASLTYLAMGAHFAQDTINRPGFSEFFLKAAGEEREHAYKLIEYLLMRGRFTSLHTPDTQDNLSNLIKINVSFVSACNAHIAIESESIWFNFLCCHFSL